MLHNASVGVCILVGGNYADYLIFRWLLAPFGVSAPSLDTIIGCAGSGYDLHCCELFAAHGTGLYALSTA